MEQFEDGRRGRSRFLSGTRYFNAEVYKWPKFGFVIELPLQTRDLPISEYFPFVRKIIDFPKEQILRNECIRLVENSVFVCVNGDGFQHQNLSLSRMVE